MRTTLDIDDDILLVAKERARMDKISIGRALAQMARAGLNQPARETTRRGSRKSPLGITPLPSRGEIITNDHVNRLRDSLGI